MLQHSLSRLTAAGITLAMFSVLLYACGGRAITPQMSAAPADSLGSERAQAVSTASLRITEFALPRSSVVDTGLSNITLGPDGNLWFGIWEVNTTSKIARITSDGHISEFAASAFEARGIVTGPDRNLWFIGGRCTPDQFVLRCRPGDVGRITTNGRVSLFPMPPCSVPLGLTPGPNGNIWLQFDQLKSLSGGFCHGGGGFVREISTTGKIVATFPNANFCCIFTDILASPIAYGPDRNLWIANYDTVVRMTARGVFTSFPIRNGSAFGTLAVPGDNSGVWFAENFGIGRVTTHGSVVQFSDPNAPQDIAAGPGGIWFTNSFSNAIGRVTPAGAITEFSVPRGISPGAIVAGPSATKRMWFTDTNLKIGTFITP